MKSYHLKSARIFLENGDTRLHASENIKLASDRCGRLSLAPEVGDSPNVDLKSMSKLDMTKSGPRGLILTGESIGDGWFVEFDSSGDRDLCYSDLRELKKKVSDTRSVFTDRTDEASATQYFQFYG